MNALFELYDRNRSAYLTLIDDCQSREERLALHRQMWGAIAKDMYLIADVFTHPNPHVRNVAWFVRALIVHGSIHTAESYLESLRRTS